MFGSLFDIAKDVTRIVVAPVEVVATIVSVPVKVVADAAEGVAREVNSALKD